MLDEDSDCCRVCLFFPSDVAAVSRPSAPYLENRALPHLDIPDRCTAESKRTARPSLKPRPLHLPCPPQPLPHPSTKTPPPPPYSNTDFTEFFLEDATPLFFQLPKFEAVDRKVILFLCFFSSFFNFCINIIDIMLL